MILPDPVFGVRPMLAPGPMWRPDGIDMVGSLRCSRGGRGKHRAACPIAPARV